jgi:hypothetical protein
MTEEPADYPPEDGVRFRWLSFPTKRPEKRDLGPIKVQRKSGGECDISRTVAGLAGPAGPRSPDDEVSDWHAV